jgi:hypothetical protein
MVPAAAASLKAAPVPGSTLREKATAGCSRSVLCSNIPSDAVVEGEGEGVTEGVAVRVAVADADAEPDAEEDAEPDRERLRVEEGDSPTLAVGAAVLVGASPVAVGDAVRDRVRVDVDETTEVTVTVAVAQAVAVNTGVYEPPWMLTSPCVGDTLLVLVAEGLSVAVPTEPVCDGDAVAEPVEEAHADTVAVADSVSDVTAEGDVLMESDAEVVFDTVFEGVEVKAPENVGKEGVAVKEEGAEGVAPPLELPCTPPPPPSEGDSDMDADSVPVAAPEKEGFAMVMEGVVVTLSEVDWVRVTDAEGEMVCVGRGEEDTEGEPAAEAVPSTLTVSVDVGDTEAEARGVPEEEGDPEPVFVAEEEAEAEPVVDAVAGAVALPSGDPEPVLEADSVLRAVTDAVEVVVRVKVKVPVPEMDDEGVRAAESVARGEPVRMPLAVAALERVAVALMLAVADTVALGVPVAAEEGELVTVADLHAVAVTDTEPVPLTESVPVADTDGEVDREPDAQ